VDKEEESKKCFQWLRAYNNHKESFQLIASLPDLFLTDESKEDNNE
jgi:hypothetical protein